jgi:predicted aconitase
MYLTDEEKRMLDGEYGQGTRKAMELQVRQGEFYDADRMVRLSMAYVVAGPDPDHQLSNYLSELAADGARFRCPTLVPPPDRDNESMQWGFEDYRRLGGIVTFGGGFGHPRNPMWYPLFGQNIMADGTAVTSFFNGVVGARANNMDAIGQHSAAIIGRAPRYGYLTPEGRLGKVLVEVDPKAKPTTDTDWSVLGYYVGLQLGRHWWDVPVFTGIEPIDLTTDDLVFFCTSLPAYGAVNHFLIVGVSPEARTVQEAFGGQQPKETIVYGPSERRQVYERFSSHSSQPDMVAIGGFGVETSMPALYRVAAALEGKKVQSGFPTFVLMNPVVRAAADVAGLTKIIEAAGVRTSLDDWGREVGFPHFNPVTDARRAGIRVAVFNNAKSCHYLGQQEMELALRDTDACLRIALTGTIDVN